VPRCQRHLFQRENLQHVSPSLQARFVATLLEVYSHILSVRIHQLSVRDAAGSVGTRPTYPNGMKSRCSDRSSMSDLSTNPDHTPLCGRGFLHHEDAGGSLSPGCRAASQAAPNAIAGRPPKSPALIDPRATGLRKTTDLTDLTDRRRRR
jgi:hypothetical protein